MARLVTSGFETGHAQPEALGGFVGGAPVFGTTVVRSGARALEVQTGSSAAEFFGLTPGMVANRDYFLRVYLRISANVANACDVLSFWDSGVVIGFAKLNTDGTLTLHNKSGTQIGSASSALSSSVWYRVELRCRVNSSDANGGTLELKLDGTQVAISTATTVGTAVPFYIFVGLAAAATTTATLYYDDVALNDDQGASQNTWPGSGKVVLLKPISDNARGTNWLAGGGGTTDLWTAVDNVPPAGLASASATNTSQVKNAANDTTGNYDANLETYTTAGIGASDTITLVQGVWNLADNTAGSGLGMRIGVVSNPTIADANVTAPAAAAGSFPTGWGFYASALSYAPSVTRGTSSVIRVGKNSGSVVNVFCDFMGLYVEYVPGGRGPSQRRPRAGLAIGSPDAVYR